MNRKQRATLRAIFTDPVPATLRWRDIETLFRTLGGVVEEAAGSRVAVMLNGIPAVFHWPHPRPEAKRSTVRAVRDLLLRAGIHPEEDGR